MALGTRWRATAWGLALLWALVPALAAIHGAVENHVYCAEHGAFEHGDRAHTAERPEHSVTDPRAPGTGDAHELCSFSDSLLRTAVTPVDATCAVSAAAPAVARHIAIADPAPPSIRILAVAPKGSPPAV